MTLLRTALMVMAALCSAASIPASAKTAERVATPTVTLDACSWDRPGIDPFMGDVVAAVDRYRDIPVEVRERLKARMAKREYDDIVSIRRDSIDGQAGQQYSNTISDMHFGTHQVCRSVTRASWTPAMQERGLVYCESGRCILVPTVCRNVSRISRKGVSPGHAEADETPETVPPGAVLAGPVNATATPLTLDQAPSFASPAGWSTAMAYGLPGAAAPTGGGAGHGPDSGGFPNVGTTSTPPGGASEPTPVVSTPVPEPQTWALMLGGLVALALARRRRVRGP